MSATNAVIIWDAILASIVVLFCLSMFGFYSAARDGARLLRKWKAMR
jgi:hypothetical protein